MAFVFYDVETTGTNTRFDQILSFAAIRTDAGLVEVERVEFRCRVDAHVVPHPGALLVTGRSLAEVGRLDLPSHYEMMRDIARLIEAWSPCTLVGFNSIRFDEEMLRHGLYRTLHNPYLTSWNGNVRADALTLCRSLAFFSPGVLVVPVDDTGKRRFTLELLSAANGCGVASAHSALADAEATLALCRLAMSLDGGCWSRFLQFASKSAAKALIDDGQPFGVVRFRGNEPLPAAAVALGPSATDANQRLCIDLSADLDMLAACTEAELLAVLKAASAPTFKLRVNACHSLCEIWDLPSEARPTLEDEECEARAERVRVDPRLGGRLLATLQAMQAQRVPSEHVEEQLYDMLPCREDDDLLRLFHQADWPERPGILARMTDRRTRRLGRRLVYLEAPQALDPPTRDRFAGEVAARRAAPAGTRPWTTIPDARAAIDELGDACTPALRAEFATAD